MGATMEFRRRWAQRKNAPHRPVRGSVAPWVPLAVVIAVAAGLFLWSKVQSGVTITGVGNNVTFRTCGRGIQRNCVVDGDTIRYDGMTIRMSDIDTPEIGDPRCSHEVVLGRRATSRLLTLLNSGPFDIVYTGGRDQDQYGRKLRVIQRNGRSLGDILIAEGLAHRWDGSKHSWCG